MLDKLIAYHCGPALAGIKPSNIAACQKNKINDIYSKLEKLNSSLNKNDIYIEVLHDCKERVLLMAYRKKVLQKQLQSEEVKRFLSDFGYSRCFLVSEYIAFLKHRMKNNSFPHEIGVFLGYPLHDICGFIYHRDDGCLLIGEWKVYADADNARKLFSRYKACRKAIINRMATGLTLEQIFCTA